MNHPEISPKSLPTGNGENKLNNIKNAYEEMQQKIRLYSIFLLLISVIEMFIPKSYNPYYPYYLVIILLAIVNIIARSSYLWIVIGVYIFTEWITQLLLGASLSFFAFNGVVVIGCFYLYNILKYFQSPDVYHLNTCN